MANPANSDPDVYYRVCKALHLVVHETIPCVDNCLKVWHTNQQQTLPPCTAQCPHGMKPELPASCPNCVAWGKAIESAIYKPPSSLSFSATSPLTWSIVSQSNLGKSYIEVAKAFSLSSPLPNNPGTSSPPYTSISHFDMGTLLTIMSNFTDFHQGHQATYDAIMKITGIRNDLARIRLEDDMRLDDKKAQQYFLEIDAFVTCVEVLYPQHFTSAQDIRTQLTEIQKEPFTPKMKEDMNLQFTRELKSVSQATQRVGQEVAYLKEIINKHIQEKAEPFDLAQCQNQLKADYKANRSSIGFIPGKPKEFPLDEFFVDLELVHEEKRPTTVIVKEIERYTDLLTLEDRRGRPSTHVLVRGDAGVGKTSMINKIAHEWATLPQDGSCDATQNSLNIFELVFALDIRHFKPDMDLAGCIHDQLLPHMPNSAIETMLTIHGDKCLYLFDGFDELKSQQEVLSSTLLHKSYVIVTTRPDKVDEFCYYYNGYVHVKVCGFSEESRETFVTKYFDSAADEKEKEEPINKSAELLKKIEESYLGNLSFFPLLLGMMCFIFNEVGEIPVRMTSLYAQAIDVFALQHHEKARPGQMAKKQIGEINEVVLSLGSTALQGLLMEDMNLIFSKEEFVTPSRIQLTTNNIWVAISSGCAGACVGLEVGLRLGSLHLGLCLTLIGFIISCILVSIKINSVVDVISSAEKLGLLSKIHDSRKISPGLTQFSFMHRTFQEFCAARYWSSLVASDKDKFRYYLSYINKSNVESMQYLIRFCCGLSSEAAEIILQHVVSSCEMEWRLPATLLYEAEIDSVLHPELHHILGRMQILNIGREIGEREMTPELWTILNHYVSHENFMNAQQTWLTGTTELRIYSDFDEDKTNLLIFLSEATKCKSFSKELKTFILQWDTELAEDYALIVANSLKRQLQVHQLELGTPLLFYFTDILTAALVGTKTYFEHLIDHLEVLALNETNMGKPEWKIMFNTIIEAGEHLKRNQSNTSADNTMDIKRRLPLRKLNLSANFLFPLWFDEEQELLQRFSQVLFYLPGLECLDLRGTGLSTSSLKVLKPSFLQLPNLRQLLLGNGVVSAEANEFDDAGSELSQCLLNVKGLEVLDLDRTGINEEVVGMLPLDQLTKLVNLNLSNNAFGSHGLIAISSSLKHVPLFEKLELRHAEIGDQGVIALSTILNQIPRLTHLDLTGNKIYNHGASALIGSLKHVPLLAHLFIDIVDDESYIAISEGFCYIPQLTQLCLVRETLEDVISVKAAESIFMNLIYLPQLDYLWIPPIDSTDIANSPVVDACLRVLPDKVGQTGLFGPDFRQITRIVSKCSPTKLGVKYGVPSTPKTQKIKLNILAGSIF